MQIILLIAWQRDNLVGNVNRLVVRMPSLKRETEVQLLFDKVSASPPDREVSGRLDAMFDRTVREA